MGIITFYNLPCIILNYSTIIYRILIILIRITRLYTVKSEINTEEIMNCIGFIGFGLIGGSIAKALKNKLPHLKIIAYTRNHEDTDTAVEEGVVDVALSSIDNTFSEADIIFICTPVKIILNIMNELKPYLSSNQTVTDVGSVKGYVHKCAKEVGISDIYIGGHPMAGSEKSGYMAAYSALFAGKNYIITKNTELSNDPVYNRKVSRLCELIALLGCNIVTMDPNEHDYAVAGISHVPHLVSAALVQTVIKMDTENKDMKRCIATGFTDSTRIAASSPEMWSQICLTNRDEILTVLDGYLDILKNIRESVANEDELAIKKIFQDARDYRNS